MRSGYAPPRLERDNYTLVIVVLDQQFTADYRCHYPGCIERQPRSRSGMAALRDQVVIEKHKQAVPAPETPKRPRTVAS
jgi:hypothetical protein